MSYLIDGYNLLHALGRLTRRAGRAALENARKELLRSLTAAAGRDGVDVTVVFDSSTAPREGAARQVSPHVEAVFAVGQTADDVIEDLLAAPRSGPRPTVVSNDHRLKEAARRRGCPWLGCLDFHEQFLQPRAAPPPADPDAEPEKPSSDDAAHWMKVFGDPDDPPKGRG